MENHGGLHRGVANSHSSPLRIAAVDAPGGGVLGMTLCPGKIGPGNRHPWARDLALDLETLADWGADCLVTLMELHELIDYRVQDLGARAQQWFGQDGWFHLPIADCSIPDAEWESQWTEVRSRLHRRLDDDQRIVLHCLGGLGRTGLVACRLLIERGLTPEESLARVRYTRPGAVETRAQEQYVRSMAAVT
ncbi:cyclin-dependent kinase inhibitor 3 family protein [Aquisalimonas sp.]|uniref:cyclin-dependent kinase inhibitor 3 family protein n=1 Tax=Aquisalimonas sp. TaxID=1872621 RepID=UPI0025C6E3E2|nr:cyclin-dependent kinase inhibitor 3 family protein [Aquisalimonas sp.]